MAKRTKGGEARIVKLPKRHLDRFDLAAEREGAALTAQGFTHSRPPLPPKSEGEAVILSISKHQSKTRRARRKIRHVA